MLSPKIETERLILRRYQESDLDAIYEIISDERLSKYIKFPKLTKDEELECIRRWIADADEAKYERWVIERKADGIVVGNIDVNTVVKNTTIAMWVTPSDMTIGATVTPPKHLRLFRIICSIAAVIILSSVPATN